MAQPIDSPTWRAIEELELASVREFVAEEGYSDAEVDQMEREYRRFLYLVSRYGDGIVPSREVDEFWHEHVLDTQKYSADCERLFGRFLHHAPFSRERAQREGGWRGQSKQELVEAFELTKKRYKETFGESFPSGAGAESARCCNSLHDMPPRAVLSRE